MPTGFGSISTTSRAWRVRRSARTGKPTEIVNVSEPRFWFAKAIDRMSRFPYSIHEGQDSKACVVFGPA